MYLRHAIRRKGGKEYTYWQLVRSVRRGGKLAQEVVAQLGELDAQGRVRARELAARITGGAMQGQLFEPLPQWHVPVAVRTGPGAGGTGARLWCGMAGLDTVAQFGA